MFIYDGQEMKNRIQSLKIPKNTVASLANVKLWELSWSFSRPTEIKPEKLQRIIEVTAKLEIFVRDMLPKIQKKSPLKLDLRDSIGLEKLLYDLYGMRGSSKFVATELGDAENIPL